jgi:protein ImuB
MPLSEARALLSSGTAWKRSDPAGDRQALRQMVLECQRYTPLTGLDLDGLLLDITGCGSLFGDERGLLTALSRELARRGFQFHAAIADTIGTAWAVARFGRSGTIVPPGEQLGVLEPLPVAALRLAADVLAWLDRLEVRTIAQLRKLPRASLACRFGPQVIQRLDQALGAVPERFTPERLAQPLFAEWNGDEPLADQRELTCVFRRLLARLLTDLSPRRAGVAELRCTLRTEAQSVVLPVRLSRPTVDARHLAQLFELACERQHWPGLVSAFRLETLQIGSLEERQGTLFDGGGGSSEQEGASLIERLSSRLGEDAVLRPIRVADPLPEHSLQLMPWLSSSSGGSESSAPEEIGSRPWRLLPSPQPVEVVAVVPDGPPARLQWGGGAWTVAQSWGPERIETGWWRGRDVQRDYYRIETEQGLWFWLFRRRDTGEWFLHGFFD